MNSLLNLFLFFSLVWLNTIYTGVSAQYSGITFPFNYAQLNNTQPLIMGFLNDTNNHPLQNISLDIALDGSYQATVISDVNGQWTYTLNSPLSDGIHTVTATVQDDTLVMTSTFTIDTSIPAVPVILAPAPDSVVDYASLMVNGTSGPFNTIFFIVNNSNIGISANADSNGNWSGQLFLNEGIYSLQVQAQNIAGTISSLSESLFLSVIQDAA